MALYVAPYAILALTSASRSSIVLRARPARVSSWKCFASPCTPGSCASRTIAGEYAPTPNCCQTCWQTRGSPPHDLLLRSYGFSTFFASPPPEVLTEHLSPLPEI